MLRHGSSSSFIHINSSVGTLEEGALLLSRTKTDSDTPTPS